MIPLKNDIAYTEVTLDCHSDACSVANFLATEGCWYEFLPVDDDRYTIAIQPRLRTAVMNFIRSELKCDMEWKDVTP